MDYFEDLDSDAMNVDYEEYTDLDSQEYYNYLAENYDHEEILHVRIEQFNWKEEWVHLFTSCMYTVGLQSISQIKILLIVCLGFKIIVHSCYHSLFRWIPSQIRINIIHIVGTISGFIILYNLDLYDFLATVKVILLYILLTYATFFVLKTHGKSSTIISILTIMFIFSGELIINNPKQWHQMRGVILLLSMKVISFAFDFDENVEQDLPNFFCYIGYCLHIGSLLFGPWISMGFYTDSILNPKRISLDWFYYVCKSLFQALVCLLLSTCVFSYLFIDTNQPELPAVFPLIPNLWMSSYQIALSFHFSHYYISYLAQGVCMLSGVGATKNSESQTWSRFVITKPLTIEFPSSMLNVVVAWNIPMSRWLKRYVFDTYSYMGQPTAILLTYTASAILHGLSFHLAAVLLSLSFYTYVEYELRKKLSRVFKCNHIQARKKHHTLKEKCPQWAYIFNSIWVLINLMHLAYLGSMFDSDDNDLEAEGYAMKHTLQKWYRLGFFSHGFAIACMIFNYLI